MDEIANVLLAAGRPEPFTTVLEASVPQEPEFHNADCLLGLAHSRAGGPERAPECPIE
ncbi:MAG: hypothetical protein OXN89_05910 [Bryobacterales bacterium]|nr:hypothetical protein [Bryobacterales bacterium]